MLADATDTVHPGCRELVDALDAAAALDDVEAITLEVQQALGSLASAGRIELSDALREPCPDAYARRLIYRSLDPAYTVL